MRIIPNPKIIYQSEEIRIVDNGKEEGVKQSHVTLLVEGVHFNLKNEILRYYGEEKLTKELSLICKKELPEYAQPMKWRFIDSMPYTPIGKVDYRALEQEI